MRVVELRTDQARLCFVTIVVWREGPLCEQVSKGSPRVPEFVCAPLPATTTRHDRPQHTANWNLVVVDGQRHAATSARNCSHISQLNESATHFMLRVLIYLVVVLLIPRLPYWCQSDVRLLIAYITERCLSNVTLVRRAVVGQLINLTVIFKS